MNTHGAPDPLYVRARAALLEATEALTPFLDAMVLVGAQAVSLQAGDSDLMVAEYTTDADFALEPAGLPDSPLPESALESHGFSLRRVPGAWLSPDGIPVDFMVPEELADQDLVRHALVCTERGLRGGRGGSKVRSWIGIG